QVERRVFRGYHTIEVFDWSQTRSLSEDYVEPDWETPLGCGDVVTMQRLVDSSPLPVRFTDLSMTMAHGYVTDTEIVIDSEAAVGNQIVELARRLGEHYLRQVPANGRPVRDGDREVVF